MLRIKLIEFINSQLIKMEKSILSSDQASQYINEQIGRRIRDLRKHYSRSLAEASELLGVSSQQLSRLERGENRISVAQLSLISAHTDTPIFWFFIDLNTQLFAKYLAAVPKWNKKAKELKTLADHQFHDMVDKPLFRNIKDLDSQNIKLLFISLVQEIAIIEKNQN